MSVDRKPIRCVVVTNEPTPYRLPMWEMVATSPDIELHLVYCSGANIDPTHSGQSDRYASHFLTGKYEIRDHNVWHMDAGVWGLLSSLKPDVVVTSGFIPTFLIAFAWAWTHRVPHIPMTDGTFDCERVLGWKHRLARRMVFASSASFLGASGGSRDLYLSYGVRPEQIHLTPLSVDNNRYADQGDPKVYDLLYCGRYVDHKNPMFAMDVAAGLADRLQRRVSLRFVGKGRLEDTLRQRAAALADRIDVSFAGYLSQAELPRQYLQSRLFLFPTGFDVWGVVANEACAAGLPCIVSPHTGVVGELVHEGRNGHVCPLDVTTWVERCAELLDNPARWEAFSRASRQVVSSYTFKAGAAGILAAVQQAVKRPITVPA